MLEALQARLKVIEDEILRVTKLAAEAKRNGRAGQLLAAGARFAARGAGAALADCENSGTFRPGSQIHEDRFPVPFPLVPRAIIRASPAGACTFPIFRRPCAAIFPSGLSQ